MIMGRISANNDAERKLLALPLSSSTLHQLLGRKREREIVRKSRNNKRERSDNTASGGEKEIVHKMRRQLMLWKK
jgi:hypothetical protein